MKRVRVVADVADLPDVTFGPRSTGWWGTLGFMVIESGTLVICAFTYLYLRKNFINFPPLGTPLPSLGVPIAQLILVGLSVVPMSYAARAARAGPGSRTDGTHCCGRAQGRGSCAQMVRVQGAQHVVE